MLFNKFTPHAIQDRKRSIETVVIIQFHKPPTNWLTDTACLSLNSRATCFSPSFKSLNTRLIYKLTDRDILFRLLVDMVIIARIHVTEDAKHITTSGFIFDADVFRYLLRTAFYNRFVRF